jgi:hypothetical protein
MRLLKVEWNATLASVAMKVVFAFAEFANTTSLTVIDTLGLVIIEQLAHFAKIV